MPAAKSLSEHVYEGTFRARRHHELLAGPVVAGAPVLAQLQSEYAAAKTDPERRAIGVRFERGVRTIAEAGEPADNELSRKLDAILATGPSRVNPARRRRESERFSRCLQAEWHHDDGVSIAKIAEALGVSLATVRRDLAYLARWRAERVTASVADRT